MALGSVLDSSDVSEEGIVSKNNHPSWSFWTGFAFSINYIIGIGVLSVPYAFASGGYLLSTVLLAISSFVAWIAVVWILESLARTESLVSTGYFGQERQGLVAAESDSSVTQSLTHSIHEISSARKFEISELVGMYFGRQAEAAYTVAVTLYMYGALWGYGAVFASSLMAFVPVPSLTGHLECLPYLDSNDCPANCHQAYLIFLAFYSLIVVSLTLMELTEQQPLQVAMCAYRFIGIGLMVITAIVAAFHGPFDKDNTTSSSPPYFTRMRQSSLPHFELAYNTAVFAQILHHSVPGLVHPLKNKGGAAKMFGTVIASTFTVYTMMGLMGVAFFGPDVKEIITLEWLNWPFSGLKSYAFENDLLAIIIVGFPVLDVLSCFSLSGLTVGNSMFGALPPKWKEGHKELWAKRATRLAAAIPPLIAAALMRHLSKIVELSGLLGFIIAFGVPALLHLKSKRACRQWWGIGADKTSYSLPVASSDVFSGTVLAVAIISLVAMAINTCTDYLSKL